jgi:hypothetical protein
MAKKSIKQSPIGMPKLKPGQLRIHISDHGQDFLWWTVNSLGQVVDCGPFQSTVWVNKCTVQNHLSLKSGSVIWFYSKVLMQVTSLNYLVQRIEKYKPRKLAKKEVTNG